MFELVAASNKKIITVPPIITKTNSLIFVSLTPYILNGSSRRFKFLYSFGLSTSLAYCIVYYIFHYYYHCYSRPPAF